MKPRYPIRNEQEYEDVLGVIDEMMASDDLSEGQVEYLNALVALVQAYEAIHYPT